MNGTPTTLGDHIRQQEAARIASNLSNLASAYALLGEEMERLRAAKEKCDALRREILAFEKRDPASITLAEVQDLYNRAMGRTR